MMKCYKKKHVSVTPFWSSAIEHDQYRPYAEITWWEIKISLSSQMIQQIRVYISTDKHLPLQNASLADRQFWVKRRLELESTVLRPPYSKNSSVSPNASFSSHEQFSQHCNKRIDRSLKRQLAAESYIILIKFENIFNNELCSLDIQRYYLYLSLECNSTYISYKSYHFVIKPTLREYISVGNGPQFVE